MNKATDATHPIEVGQENFGAEVLKSDRPVLALFQTSWSQPCRVLEAVLNEVMSGQAVGARLVKINADDNPDLSLWYGIGSIPTLLIFIDGVVRARIVGTASKEAVLGKLKSSFETAALKSNLKPSE